MERPHGCDLRKGRISLRNQIYLVTTTTYRRQRMLATLSCARILVRTLASERANATTMAYVVMPDHFHWLLRLVGDRALETVVQSVKSVSSHRVNELLGRKGSVWQVGFHDHALRRDEDLERVARYVIHNPVRAGLAERIEDYPHWDAFWL